MNKARQSDKVLDNAYKTGSIDVETFDNGIKIDTNYVSVFLDDSHNMYDSYRMSNLMDLICRIFTESKYSEKYFSESDTKKKIPKNALPELYEFLESSINDVTYSACEKFCVISDFCGVSYKIMIDSIYAYYLEDILDELREYDEKLNTKLGIGRLF